MPAEAGIRFGQYILQRRIARGGMAEVFLAQQRGADGVDRRVAVKRILPHHADTPAFIQMFLGEGRLAAQLSHRHIVDIHEFGKVDADYFIAMEYVDGVHTGEVIRRGGADRLPPALIARIGADAAAALHYAHELCAPDGRPYGLVHRDVSPANLMVSFDGVVKLCDFGIAKAVGFGDRPMTRAGVVRGKYAYMSPEQTVGTPLDGRSDVYTLAIVLWELAAGEPMVPRGDAIAAMHAIRHGRLTPLERAAPDTPPALARAIASALATDRAQRPTAAQFGEALELFIAASNEPSTPAALGAWLRARFVRESSEVIAGRQVATQETSGTHSEPFGAATASPIAPAPGLAATGAETIIVTDTTSETVDGGPIAAGGARAVPEAASTFMLENADTLMRSGAFRLPVPSGPSAVPTMLDARPLALPAGAPPTAPTLIAPPIAGAPQAGPMHMAPPSAQTLLAAPPPMVGGSPLLGVPAIPGQFAPMPGAPPSRLRIGRIAAAMIGVALLAFVIALAARGKPPEPASQAAATAGSTTAATVAGAGSTSAAAAAGAGSTSAAAAAGAGSTSAAAAPVAPTPPAAAGAASPAATAAPAAAASGGDGAAAPAVAAAAGSVGAGAAAPARAATAAAAGAAAAATAAIATATLDVHTSPAGATVLIRRCRSIAGKCTVDRTAAETPIGDCPSAPCSFTLPIGSYEIVVERDGERELRTVTLMTDVATSLDILFKPPAARRATGKLTVRATPPCQALLDGRVQPTPITELELRAGLHKLELQCGRRPWTTRSVMVAAGKTTQLDATR